MKNRRRKYLTGASRSNVVDCYRDYRSDGGIDIYADSNEIIAQSSWTSRSPLWHESKLVLGNPGTSEFSCVDVGARKFVPITLGPGHMLEENTKAHHTDLRFGFHAIDLRIGDAAHRLRIEGIFNQSYNFIALPGIGCSMAFSLKIHKIRQVVSVEK